MADVYDGEGDGRQAKKPMTPTRFRPRYRQLSEAEIALHDDIKDKAAELEALFDRIDMDNVSNPGVRPRYRALAITELEASVMWAVKALTS